MVLCLGLDEEHAESLWVRNKGQDNMVMLLWVFSRGHLDR